MGAFTFKPGGRVKLDVIRDFKPIGNEDAFDTRTIPVDGSEGTNSTSACQGDAAEPRYPRPRRRARTADVHRDRFLRHQQRAAPAPRLRLWGGLLAGQTWTTFVDEDNMPRTIDFESPTAFASIRQAQVRWTQKLGDERDVVGGRRGQQVGDHDPRRISRARPNTRCPISSRASASTCRADTSTTAAFVGAARFRPTEGRRRHGDAVGRVVSAKFNLLEHDSIYGVFTRRGHRPLPRRHHRCPRRDRQRCSRRRPAFMGGYEHFWSERWSTNAVYSIADTSDEPFYTSAINKQLDLRRRQPPVLVPRRPGVDGRRVSLRPPRGVRRRRRRRHGAPGAVCRSLQPPLSSRDRPIAIDWPRSPSACGMRSRGGMSAPRSGARGGGPRPDVLVGGGPVFR